MTDEEIETEYWADHYTRNPKEEPATDEEVANLEDFDLSEYEEILDEINHDQQR